MLLVKKISFSLYLFSVKIREKKTFLSIKNSIFQSPKKLRFSKGVTHAFGQKFFSLVRFSDKIKLEMMFNNVLYRNETSFAHTKFNLLKSQKLHFSKGVNPCFWSFFFSLLISVKMILQIMFNNVLDRKETFFGRKNFNISKSQKLAIQNLIFQSPKNCIFLMLLVKKCHFFVCFWSKYD